ncbi:hypothetical protein JVT61DRAFT_12670 [Boletus reticuloceps]|uniref:HBS1-like protein N-terminal domain-containing protein n=1 Tax=Boletus reticuloceps TaxID=495285 RepID=A0A8I2YTR6_9AGAM|nr:hypothetical protein JVT61DRAFT_12670 [Boletus reticuloceps]
MSRHRLVRNIDIHAELDDAAFDDDGDDLTEEQHAQMESALEQIRAIIGDEATSGLDDAIIRDTLWEFYFDIEQSVPRLLEEQDRRAAARERKEHSSELHPTRDYPYRPVDPNRIPPSPSPSALKRLSSYDSAPSLHTPAESEIQSETPNSPPRAPSISVPATDNIPEIPDFTSKSSEKPPQPPEKDLPRRPQPPKRSKLAELASSRASMISSSRSSDLESTSSSRTTTAKPPQSEVSVQSMSSVKAPRTPKRPTSTASVRSSPSIKPPSTTTSSMSSHVRKAIQTAMDLEAHDQQAATRKQVDNMSDVSVSTVKPEKHAALPRSPVPTELPVAPSEPDAKTRPQSKLAKLAQAKAHSHALVPCVPASPPKELPRPHTEFLTPIANGATATTAITTTYQSLQSLSTPQSLEPVSLVQMPGAETRSSKLALKAKKVHTKLTSHSSVTDDECSLPPTPPLFLPSPTCSCALPSAFASLLLDDPLTSSEDKDKDRKSLKYGREEPHIADMYQASLSRSKSTLGYEVEQQKRSHGHVEPLTSPDLTVRSTSFAFDVPSPDDIVFNARRGTALGQRR